MPRSIVHLDADAFFASVEQAADPRLRGKAIAVGGEKRGIIASASYEARRFGVYTPMPSARARKLCPKLIILPGDFEKYERFSRWMFSYAYDFTPEVEIGAIDEGYFDLTSTRRSPVEVAEKIRRAIRDSLKITVSEGIASNKLVSQIASKLNKPAAFTCVESGYETRFLHPLPNRWLPGIGPKTAERLNSAGLARIQQIAATPADLLFLIVGNSAPLLKEYANGIDDRPIVPVSAPAKSYSQQETFAVDQTNEEWIEAVLRRMADHLMAKVREEEKSIRTLTVKVRYNDMAEDQAAESLEEPTDLETDLYPRLRILLRKAWKRRVSLRLVSLKFSQVYQGIFRVELPLERSAREREARQSLAQTVDRLRKTHGREIILRGHDFILRAASDRKMGLNLSDRAKKFKNSFSKNFLLRDTPGSPAPIRRSISNYLPLQVHSYYSFLDSTLSIRAMIELAREHEMPAIALTDRQNLHGAVEFFQMAKAARIKPILGVQMTFQGKEVCLYVQNTTGYSNLCQLLTEPKALKTGASEMTEGLIGVSPSPELASLFPGRFYVGIADPQNLSRQPLPPGLKRVALLPIHYARADERWKYQVVQSIRTRTLLDQEHPEKKADGEFYFRSPAEMKKRFENDPDLILNTLEIAERCSFDLPLTGPQFPAYRPSDGSSPAAFLRQRVKTGLRKRYPQQFTALEPQVEQELAIIHEVGYEEYFLVVWDLLQECRRHGIDWITRGSAADSLVCYCLEISGVCPIRFELYFRRFLNKDRMKLNKLPDIDLDFPHDRKDEVIDLIFEKYGRSQAAVVGGFSTYQARSALGDVAKVLGVSEYQIRRVTERLPHYTDAQQITDAVAQTPECADLPLLEEPYQTALKMAEFLNGFPRHPKMHPCGVVLSRQPIHTLVPTFISNKGYPTTHFDMDAVEAIGLVKMDILAQGGLAVMRDVEASLAQGGIAIDLEKITSSEKRVPNFSHKAELSPAISPGLSVALDIGLRTQDCANAPWNDPAVWEMIASGGARAVHHIESPAMIGLCRMCNVRDIDTLIAIVSVIRPGAANESKKREFTRRYQGLAPVEYPHPSIEPCLRSSFGLVVYEEHILQICEAFAGLPPGRADVLRRALGKEQQETITEIEKEFVLAARLQGRTEEAIQRVWELVKGFRGYAFCKAHSTAYGIEAYQSAWLKRYYPAEFMAAVLTNGKGFYHPLVYVLECHRLGIGLLPPWINEPGPGFTVTRSHLPEETDLPEEQSVRLASAPARIRAPVTYAKGLSEQTKQKIISSRRHGSFLSISDFYHRVHPSSEEVEILLHAGAFDNFGKSRTAQYWELQSLLRSADRFTAGGQGRLWPREETRLPATPLEEPGLQQRLEWEAELFGFCVSDHPLRLYPDVAWETYCPVTRLPNHIGEEVVLCGLIIEERLHHQVTGEPMKFITLADWTGMIETELFAKTYKSYGLATVRYPVLEVTATVEPFENARGFSLRVLRAGKPRQKSDSCSGKVPFPAPGENSQ